MEVDGNDSDLSESSESSASSVSSEGTNGWCSDDSLPSHDGGRKYYTFFPLFHHPVAHVKYVGSCSPWVFVRKAVPISSPLELFLSLFNCSCFVHVMLDSRSMEMSGLRSCKILSNCSVRCT